MSAQHTTLKLSPRARELLRHLRMNGTVETYSLGASRAMITLAEIGYIKVGTKTTLTAAGRIIADHLIANAK